MRVGLFKRILSYLIDMMPIIVILSLLFSGFVGDLLKPVNYDQHYQQYLNLQDEYFSRLDPYQEQYNNGTITKDELQAEYDTIVEDFNVASKAQVEIIAQYFILSILYYVFSAVTVYFLYSAFTRGRTLGRRLLKIELGGKITIWRLFVREVIWRAGYWTVTFFIGGILLDIAMISFSRRKLAPRDMISGIYVKYEGVDYPF